MKNRNRVVESFSITRSLLFLALQWISASVLPLADAFSAEGSGGNGFSSPSSVNVNTPIKTPTMPVMPATARRPHIPPTAFARTSAIDDKIDIHATADGIKGLGAFATTSIDRGTIVGELHGERVSRRDVEARYWSHANNIPTKQTKKIDNTNKSEVEWRESRERRGQGMSGDYLFGVDGNDYAFIDVEDADCSSWCRFVNHANPDSEACNVEVRSGALLWWAEEDNININDDHLYLIAMVDIAQGSELCYDYGEDYWGDDDYV